MQDQNKLDQAVAAFEHWRQTRTQRDNIPDELRGLALALLDDHRIGQVTKALRICSTQIKTWRQQMPAKQPAPDFIPLSVESDAPQKSALSLHLLLPNAAQIRISGDVSPDLLQVLIQQAGTQR